MTNTPEAEHDVIVWGQRIGSLQPDTIQYGNVAPLHARQYIASMLHQLIQISILPAFLLFLFEKHLQDSCSSFSGHVS